MYKIEIAKNMDNASIVLREYEATSMPMYSDKNIELVSVLTGELTLSIYEHVYTLSEGDTALVMPDILHSLHGDKNTRYRIISLTPDYALEATSELESLVPDSPIISGLDIDALWDMLSNDIPNKYRMISIVNDIMSKYVIGHTLTSENEKIACFVRDTVGYIMTNYDKEPTIEELSEHLGYATHYVSGLVGNVFGMTFSALLNERRIARSIELLRDKLLTIAEVATASGYSSTRSYNRNFSLLIGMSPSEYRESI